MFWMFWVMDNFEWGNCFSLIRQILWNATWTWCPCSIVLVSYIISIKRAKTNSLLTSKFINDVILQKKIQFQRTITIPNAKYCPCYARCYMDAKLLWRPWLKINIITWKEILIQCFPFNKNALINTDIQATLRNNYNRTYHSQNYPMFTFWCYIKVPMLQRDTSDWNLDKTSPRVANSKQTW